VDQKNAPKDGQDQMWDLESAVKCCPKNLIFCNREGKRPGRIDERQIGEGQGRAALRIGKERSTWPLKKRLVDFFAPAQGGEAMSN